MKQIIDGKLYDTDKSIEVCRFVRKVAGSKVPWNPELVFMNRHDFILYKTQNGRYFEYDQDDEIIRTRGEEYAKELLEQLNPDKYIELFGEVEEA